MVSRRASRTRRAERSSTGIATWDGDAWSALTGVATGLNGRVTAVTTYQGDTVVAGQFYWAGTEAVPAPAARTPATPADSDVHQSPVGTQHTT